MSIEDNETEVLTKTVNFITSKQLHIDFKKCAAHNDENMTDIFNQAMRLYVENNLEHFIEIGSGIRRSTIEKAALFDEICNMVKVKE